MEFSGVIFFGAVIVGVLFVCLFFFCGIAICLAPVVYVLYLALRQSNLSDLFKRANLWKCGIVVAILSVVLGCGWGVLQQLGKSGLCTHPEHWVR